MLLALFGTRTNSNVFRQIYPAIVPEDRRETQRARDIGALRSRATMQHILTANDFCLGIRKQRGMCNR